MIVLDLSRLVSRAGLAAPTGIDRVELAYAEHLIAAGPPHCFVMMTPLGRFGLLPRALAGTYVGALAASWRDGSHARQRRRNRSLARKLQGAALLRGERSLCAGLRAASQPPVYLLVSHHHLERQTAIARLKARGRTRFVCFVHDLIPIEFPEYARSGEADRHRRRMASAAALADAVVVNSPATGAAFAPVLRWAGRAPPVLVAPLGVDLAFVPAAAPADQHKPEGPPPVAPPYFVCLGTIEARKNHVLLLTVWRRLAAEFGPRAPRLVLIGRRGWESESAVDMLERCPGLSGLVREENGLCDRGTARLVDGARALLLPSFAEGFGLPLAEALARGVPVLGSDIPALRETGGGVPDYLDPLDGPGWRAAILDYAAPASPRRAAQLDRLSRWRPPRWPAHFAAVMPLIAAAAKR